MMQAFEEKPRSTKGLHSGGLPTWAAQSFVLSGKEGKTHEYMPRILPVDAIFFTQTTISKMTKNKQSTLAQLVAELLIGKIHIQSLELDDVTEAGSHTWSCNNRRLCVLKCYQEVSRAFQVILYGMVPTSLFLMPYVQIRCFVQTERTPYQIRELPDVRTPRCPGHNFSAPQWREAEAQGHGSVRVRVSEANGGRAARGVNRENTMLCPEGFSLAIVEYCTKEAEDDAFLRWAASSAETASDVPLNEKARNSLGSLRSIVQQILRAPHKYLALPRGVEELLGNAKMHDTSDQRSRSRSPTHFPPKMRKEDLTGKHTSTDQNLLRGSMEISLGGG
jgi:hypothetical protein